MLEFEEARATVLARAAALGAEEVAIEAAAGRVLAEDVTAGQDVPAFENSAMDGYARARRRQRRRGALRVVAESQRRASRERRRSDRGRPARSRPGRRSPRARTPSSASRTRAADGDRVELIVAVERDNDVRHVGDDVRAGEVVLRAGTTDRRRPSSACSRRSGAPRCPPDGGRASRSSRPATS